MPAAFELYTLGLPRLVSPGGDEVRFKVRKHLALLVFLAVEAGRGHRRERLIELLWPDVPLQAGRQSLATALSVIRARIGRDALESDRYHVRLAVGRVKLDLERLESGEVLGDDFTPPLEVAGFLEGFEISSASTEFALWRDRKHATLLPDIKAALIRLADFARRTADLHRLGSCADRLLAIDDLAEEGIRARMETAALTGDRLTAIRVYDEWVERLRHELGASPPPLLEGMALRLRRRGWERPATSAVPTVRTEQWRDRPFVGRKREYRVLYEIWEQVAQSTTRHVLLYGDSGVGKTTLADRLATAIGLEGATVARVRCFELERGIPFAMIREVLTALLDRPGASATNPDSLAELARIIPGVRQRYPSLPQAVETHGESARIQFAEAAYEFLRALMEEHPVVLIVDDFQLSDEASASVLHFLMRRTKDLPLFVVMVSRTELPDGNVYTARIRSSSGPLGITLFELAPMPEEESSVLLESLGRQIGKRPNATERKAILRAAGGYPMALELLVRDWEVHGAASQALALGAMTADVSSTRDVYYGRLADSIDCALDPTTRTVLQMAALLDRRLNELSMYELLDLTIGQTMTSLAELVHRGALRDAGTGLEFLNPGIRASTYLNIPPSFRRFLHERVSVRLLERVQGGEAVPGLEIAWHCVRAGRPDKAAPHLLRGAREAITNGAPHETELALSSGMSLLEGSQVSEGTLLLSEALQELGRWQDSLLRVESGQTWEDPNHATLAQLLALEARYRLGALDADDRDEALTSFRTILREHPDVGIRARALLLAASMVQQLGSHPAAAAISEAAREGPVVSEPASDRLRWLLGRAMLEYELRHRDEAERLLRDAEKIATSSALKNRLAAHLFNGLGAVMCSRGNYSGALKPLEQGFAIATNLDNDLAVASIAANIALCHYRLGNYRDQIAVAQAARHRFAEVPASTTAFHLLKAMALGWAFHGNADNAHKYLDRILDAFVGADRSATCQWALLIAADVHQVLGNDRIALSYATTATTGDFSRPATISHVGQHARWLASLVARGVADPSRGRALIRGYVENLGALDAIDEVEVLCALRKAECSGMVTEEAMETALARLPRAVRSQLSAFGAL